ncbi:hypothetical protein [Nocardiopsis sp. NPDC057823]
MKPPTRRWSPTWGQAVMAGVAAYLVTLAALLLWLAPEPLLTLTVGR